MEEARSSGGWPHTYQWERRNNYKTTYWADATMSNCVTEFRGCASNTKECTRRRYPSVEKSNTSRGYYVAASTTSNEQLTCTLFFSPSEEIRKDEKKRTTLSRRLTKLLRHDAPRRGLPIGSDGYVCVSRILALPEYGQFSMSDLLYIAEQDEKGRYSVRVGESVALNTRRGNSKRKGKVVDDCTDSGAAEVNPLFEQDSPATAKSSPLVEGRPLNTVVCDDEERVQVTPNNSPAGTTYTDTVYVEYRNDVRGELATEEAPGTAFVLHRQSYRLCTGPDGRRLPCLVQSTGNNSARLRNDCYKAECSGCSVKRLAHECCREVPAGAPLDVRSATAKQEAGRLRSDSSPFSGYVDASQVSIRAVQGHSLAVVDSEKLLRRVLTLGDLVGSVTRPTVQMVSSSGNGKSFSRGTYQPAANSSFAGAIEPAGAAASASNVGICLVHGTYWRHWENIQKTGLRRMSRNHIHFTTRLPGEGKVISGMRPNAEIFIYLDVARVFAAGLPLYISENGVVLSPGNKKGVIECKFFEKVVDRRTGKYLRISGNDCTLLQTEDDEDGVGNENVHPFVKY